MPLVLLDGPCQVERDVPESNGLGEVILDGRASLCNTCTRITSFNTADQKILYAHLLFKHSLFFVSLLHLLCLCTLVIYMPLSLLPPWFVVFVSGHSSTGPSTRKEPTTAGDPASPTE